MVPFVAINKRLEGFFNNLNDADLQLCTLTLNITELYGKWESVRKELLLARRQEFKNVGVNVEDTIQLYKKAVYSAHDLLSIMGTESYKLEKIRKFFLKKTVKMEVGIMILTAIFSAVIGAVIGAVITHLFS